MKKNEVKTGQTYRVKVSGQIVDVCITSENANGGWDGVNVSTNRKVRIKTAGRLRRKAVRPKTRKKIVTLSEYESNIDEQVTAQRAANQVRKDIARTVKAVQNGDLTKGITVPTARKKRNTGERGATGGKPDGKKMSLLDAAAHILSLGAALPMRCQDIVDLAIDRSLWMPGKGKTPASTLYAAIHREIKTKGDASRFRKAERGKFELNH